MIAKTKILGTTGVDSGQLLITDPCYPTTADHKGLFEYDNLTLSGEDNSKQVINKHGAEVGVVVNTTIGDGSFPVIANCHKDGTLLYLTIPIEC